MHAGLKELMKEYEQAQGFADKSGIPSDEASGFYYLGNLIQSDKGILVENENGYCMGFVVPYACNPRVLVAQEMGCYSRDGREEELREEFDKIAKAKGCKAAVYSCFLDKEGTRFRKYEDK